jgi:hypothetical protein
VEMWITRRVIQVRWTGMGNTKCFPCLSTERHCQNSSQAAKQRARPQGPPLHKARRTKILLWLCGLREARVIVGTPCGMLCSYSNYSRERKRVILRKKLTMPSQAISSEMRSRLVTVRGFVWRKTLFRQRGQTNPKVAPENRSTARVESGGAGCRQMEHRSDLLHAEHT